MDQPEYIDEEAVIKEIGWHEDTLEAFMYGAELVKEEYGLQVIKELELQSVEEEEYHLAEGYKRCLTFMNLCLLVNRI